MNSNIYSNIAKLGQIVDFIHDQSFDIDHVRFEDEILTIEFMKERTNKEIIKGNIFLWKKSITLFEECILLIHNVKDYQIKDTEKIGIYDFNTIDYYTGENKIRINTSIPMDFEISISKFKIEIIETGVVIEKRTKTKLF